MKNQIIISLIIATYIFLSYSCTDNSENFVFDGNYIGNNITINVYNNYITFLSFNVPDNFGYKGHHDDNDLPFAIDGTFNLSSDFFEMNGKYYGDSIVCEVYEASERDYKIEFTAYRVK